MKAPPKGRRRLRRVAQVLLALAFAGTLVIGFAYHRARAQVSESLMDLGAQMMRYTGARAQDAPRDLELNGQVIRMTSGTADHSLKDVLDFYEARCAEVDGGLLEELEALHRSRPDVIEAPPPGPLALREDNGGRGYVACMDLGGSIGTAELAARVARYAATGDVADIGQMRYVFAEEYQHEGHPRTHFVAMWTTGSFNLRRMFPEEGDAPGHDVRGIDRPRDARRVLSGRERGQPYSIRVYQTRDDEADLERFYRTSLAEHGWTLLEHPERRPSSAAPRVLVAEQGERMLTIVLSTDLRTGHGHAAVIEAR